MLRKMRSCVGRPRAASDDGIGNDGSPGCSESQVEWGCCPGMSCSQLPLGHGRQPVSSSGIPAETPKAAEGEV